MANRDYPHVKIKEGDTVVVSATPIPGNETSVQRVIGTPSCSTMEERRQTYDPENRLVETRRILNTGMATAIEDREYWYDALGRRATLTDGASRYSILVDPRWSTSMLLDQNRVVKAAYGYSAYGSADSALTKTAAGFNASTNLYRYTGKRLDSGSGSYDMGARRYSPPAARFLQRDLYTDALADLGLATDPLTGNRYAYTAANPVNYVELDGHRPVDVHESAYSPISQAATQQFIRDQLAQACQGDYCRSGLERAINAADLLTSLPSPAALAKLGIKTSIKTGIKLGTRKTAGKAAARALATDADEAVFWSGIRGGAGTASQWAASNAGATLESTIARGGIKLPAWDPSNVASVAAWRSASREFAAGARGNVRVLQDDAVRVRSIWAQVEYPALKANLRVTSIAAVNPRTGVTKVLWSR